MKLLFASILFLLLSCDSKKTIWGVELTDTIDPDIVLVNIGKTNRAGIAELLVEIEKCQPAIVALDVLFRGEKEPSEDSALAAAFKFVENDILAYGFLPTWQEDRSFNNFRRFAKDEGHISIGRLAEMSIDFTPIIKERGFVYESFALRIIKLWKPVFNYKPVINKSIRIDYTRTLNQFHHFNRQDLSDKNVRDLLKNKVVLVGYIGPEDEDKHFTPMRYSMNIPDSEPDTYGLVIQANIIRTLLKQEN